MEKYPSKTRARLMEDTTSIRTVIACPGGGHIVTLGFPGLAFDIQGDAYIDPERLEATVSAPALSDCSIFVVLVERDEVPPEAWQLLQGAAEARSIRLVHLPIPDYQVPDQAFMTAWRNMDGDLTGALTAGGTVALACHYGAGRSGTIAAGMLIERGYPLDRAIAVIRSGFSESIESEMQLEWLRRIAQE
ncbi:hypothetical protein [Roseibium sp.]|uniref:protein-tyrosine phosphatase family protein n=1 Tax=Roseibium sp. TaxID=1936156 RepID=UPI00326636CA